MILRWEMILDYPGGPNAVTRSLYNGSRKVRVREGDGVMEAQVRVMQDEKDSASHCWL